MSNLIKEPYLDFFIKNDFHYVGSGWMHHIFEKENRIYKIVKSDFAKFDSIEMYELEKLCMDFLRKHGYTQVVKIYKIYDKNEFIKDFCVLEEEKAVGTSMSKDEISRDLLDVIYEFYIDCIKISGEKYGAYSIDAKNMFDSWEEYLKVLLERCEKVIQSLNLDINFAEIQNYFLNEYSYNGPPSLLIMDPNVENFFFDETKKEISAIIDIDHPIFGDPLYQWSFFTTNVEENSILDEKYQKIGFVYGDQKCIDLLIDKGIINKNTYKAICCYSMVFCLNDLFFRMKFQQKKKKNQYDDIIDKLMAIYKNHLTIIRNMK